MTSFHLPSEAGFDDFLTNLEIPRYDPGIPSRPVTISGGEEGGFVEGASLVSFVADLSAQNRNDVLASTLLAQLAADKKYEDDPKNMKGWYDYYQYVLRHSYWDAQEWDFNEVHESSSMFGVQKVMLDVITAMVTGDELAVVRKTIEALDKLPKDDDRIKLWDSQTHSSNTGKFQAAVATETKGAVALAIGGFSFTCHKRVDQLLWFKFESSDADFYQAHQTATLFSDEYAKHARQKILDKLGDRFDQFIDEIEL
ncbi:hypothetical protein [Streptomyces sp. NPDC002403]